MTENQEDDNQSSDKQLNFRALESKFERQLDEKNDELSRIKQEADRMREQLTQRQTAVEDEESNDLDPYVDNKRLTKVLGRTTEKIRKDSQGDIQNAIQKALAEERQNNWMKSNPDFYDVLKKADKLAELNPALADTIVAMPEGFERQKLVYQNIKALGLEREQPKESVQDKIDSNRRSPYYQPSGVSAGPTAPTADYSKGGQKLAYENLLKLKKGLRL